MKFKTACLSLSLALLLPAGLAVPVWAQGSPFWYLYMGQSLLYPLTRTVGLGNSFRYGPYNANPFYSTGSYMRNINSKAIQWPYIYPYANKSYGPFGYRNAGMMPGTTGNANGDATNVTAADEPDSADPSANTMNSANPYQIQDPAQTQPAGKVPVVPSSGGAPGGNLLPSWAPPPVASPTSAPPVASAVAASAPPVAPAHTPAPAVTSSSSASSTGSSSTNSSATSTNSSATSTNSSAATQALGRPLAEGFINHLNTNYQGDMSKALSNNDTRSWARAMGVIDESIPDGSHLSGDRLEVIGRVLKDNTLDPLAKLDTMRILLKKNPAATR